MALTLPQSKELLEAVLDSMGEGVFVVDNEGKMIMCNKRSEEILGVGLVDLPLSDRIKVIGNYLDEQGTPFPLEELPIFKAIKGIPTNSVEIFIRNHKRPNGIWIRNSGRPLLDLKGKLIGGVAVFQEITSEKNTESEKARLEEQIYRSQKLESLGLLAGGIAHDFNNLLVGVLGNADILIKNIDDENETLDRAFQIKRAALRLSELTNQLLAYAGKGKFNEGVIDLSELVGEMTELMRPVVAHRSNITYDLTHSVPTIYADPTQIRQVVMNLISNSADAQNGRPGSILVKTYEVDADEEFLQSLYLDSKFNIGKYVVLEVSDQGKGMDEDTLSKIFDPFYTTKSHGRGLGLAAVLGIVRRHKGAIAVESEPDVGTTFKLLFPALGDKIIPQEEKKNKTSRVKFTGTAIVIDDEDMVREVTKAMLEHLGFSVEEYSSGSEALNAISSGATPEVIVLDLTMPDMTGDEVLKELGTLGFASKTILCSGYYEAEVDQRLVGLERGAYLQKPFTLEALKEAVEKAHD